MFRWSVLVDDGGTKVLGLQVLPQWLMVTGVQTQLVHKFERVLHVMYEVWVTVVCAMILFQVWWLQPLEGQNVMKTFDQLE